MDFRKSRNTLIFAASLLGIWMPAHGAEPDPKGLIEIEYPVEILESYKLRRPDHQLTFHFQYETFKPSELVFPGLGTHEQVFNGAAASITNLSLGYKFNLPVVGIDLSAFTGFGGLAGGSGGANYVVQKTGARIAAIFDGVMNEPYVAPYFGIQYFAWKIGGAGTSSFSGSLGPATGMQAGLLLQLNWLEPHSALKALSDDGLNNTYLDLFMQQYANTGETNLASSFNWGAGFRLEY